MAGAARAMILRLRAPSKKDIMSRAFLAEPRRVRNIDERARRLAARRGSGWSSFLTAPRPWSSVGPMRRTLATAVLTSLAALSFGGCHPNYPACDSDEDCQREGRKEFCVNKLCQKCRNDKD